MSKRRSQTIPRPCHDALGAKPKPVGKPPATGGSVVALTGTGPVVHVLGRQTSQLRAQELSADGETGSREPNKTERGEVTEGSRGSTKGPRAREIAENPVERLTAIPTHLHSAPEATVWADPDRILQTLVNLLSNAVKFSPAGATVRVSAEHRKHEVVFRVTDEGRGIPIEKQAAVFERFQQVDASDTREKGGTGLAICRRSCDSTAATSGSRAFPVRAARSRSPCRYAGNRSRGTEMARTAPGRPCSWIPILPRGLPQLDERRRAARLSGPKRGERGSLMLRPPPSPACARRSPAGSPPSPRP